MRLQSHIWPAIVGVLLGVVMAPLVGLTGDLAEDAYDQAFPVAEATATVVERREDGWMVQLSTRKARACNLIETQAFDMAPNGDTTRLIFERKDDKPAAQMPPGNFRSVVYRLVPPPKHRLVISYLHQCGSRVVRTPVLVEG